MEKLSLSYKLKVLLLLAVLPSVSWANFSQHCLMGESVAGRIGVNLKVNPDVAIGKEIGSVGVSNTNGKYLTVACNGNSLYRSETPLTPSATVANAYETGIPGVGVIISDLYKKYNTVPGNETIPGVYISPFTGGTIILSFVKTGPITPGKVGEKLYSTYSLDSTTVATVTVSNLAVSFKK